MLEYFIRLALSYWNIDLQKTTSAAGGPNFGWRYDMPDIQRIPLFRKMLNKVDRWFGARSRHVQLGGREMARRNSRTILVEANCRRRHKPIAVVMLGRQRKSSTSRIMRRLY